MAESGYGVHRPSDSGASTESEQAILCSRLDATEQAAGVASPAAALHERVLHRAVHGAGGRLLEGATGTVVGVFDTAEAAATAAVEAHREMRVADFAAVGLVRPRMGLHWGPSGSDEELSRAVRFAICIDAAANDGQVVASSAFTRACERLADGTHWNNLGEHLLAGVRDPAMLFELAGEGLGSDFPPLHTTPLRPLPDTTTRERKLFLRLAEARDTQAVARVTVHQLVELTGSRSGAFLTQSEHDAFGLAWEQPAGAAERLGSELVTRAAAQRHTVLSSDNRAARPTVAGHLIAIPLLAEEQTVAVVLLEGEAPYEPEVIDELEALCPTICAALTASRDLEAMTELALVDGLTELANRRSFDFDLEAAVETAASSGVPVSVVMIDVDHFKVFNDVNGHLQGDEVLRRVARVLSDALRPEDQIYRYGGEEFAVILRSTDAETARAVGERLRSAVEDAAFRGEDSQPGGRVTVSVGLASGSDRSGQDLIEAADQALYRVKNTGRNRVSLEGGNGMPPSGRARRGNLPHPVDAVVGRDETIRDVASIISENRLVTLTGVGGVGKTRMALAIAEEVGSQFPNGVWLCPLVTAGPDLVASAVSEALGIRARSDEPILDTLVRALTGSRRLLVLDNCEHLVQEAAGFVSQLLGRCPDVKVLATSRESLNLPGERIVPIPPLSLTGAGASRSPAADLFVRRASAIRPALDFDGRDDVVERICQRLSGLPLALELAAAKVRVLSVDDIADRLDRDFELLSAGNRRADRQATLHNAIDWSYQLLDADEQTLFRRLTVFNGSADLRAIHAIAGVDEDDMATLDMLEALVRKSLVIAEPDNGRFRLLEPLREFGMQILREEGEADTYQRAHASWYLDHLKSVMSDPANTLTERMLATITEIHNLRHAIDWAADAGETSIRLRLATELGPLWVAGPIEEGITRIERALEEADNVEPADRILARGRLAWQYTHAGAPARARELAESSLALSAEMGLPECGAAHLTLANLDLTDGETVQAVEHARLAQDLADHDGHLSDADQALNVVAGALVDGQQAEAAVVLDEMASRWPIEREPSMGMLVIAQRAVLAAKTDPPRAVELCEEAARVARAGGATPALVSWCSIFRGRCQLMAGDSRGAGEAFVASLEIQAASGYRVALSATLTGLAVALSDLGRSEAASELFASAQGVRDANGLRGYAWEQRWASQVEVSARPWSPDRITDLISDAKDELGADA